MKEFVLPEYTKSLPDNACLSREEVSKIFGYSGKGEGILYGMKHDLVPKYDHEYLRKGKKPRQYWTLGLLRSLENKDGNNEES